MFARRNILFIVIICSTRFIARVFRRQEGEKIPCTFIIVINKIISEKKKRKTLIKNKNCHKQQTLGAIVCTLTSDFKTCHITRKPNYSFHKTGKGVRKSQGALITHCLLPSPPPIPPPPPHCFPFPPRFSVQSTPKKHTLRRL